MSLLKQLTIAIIFIAAIIAGGIYLFSPKTIRGIVGAFTGKTSVSEETKCPDPVPVFCPNTTFLSGTLHPLEIATGACKIFGSFTIGDFSNIENLMPEFSENYRTKMTEWIAKQKDLIKSDAPEENGKAADSMFNKIVSVPIESKTIFSDEKNTEVIIKVTKSKIKENAIIDSSNENCSVELKKIDDKWKIENISFSKLEN